MAANEFMPDPTIAQTDPERSEGNDRFPEVTRKKMRVVFTAKPRSRQRYTPAPTRQYPAPPAASCIPESAIALFRFPASGCQKPVFSTVCR